MSKTVILCGLVLAVSGLPVAAAASEQDGFDRPRRASGSMFVRPRAGSLPWDGEEWARSAVPVTHNHYAWDPEYLTAARREAYVSTEVGEGRIVGNGSSSTGGSGRSRAPSRGVTFDGLNAATAAFQGRFVFPPDAIIGASPTRVLQGSNVALRLTDRAGSEIDRVPLNTFFGFAANELLYDPKVYFDRLSERFFVVALEQQEETRRSGIWLAVSKGSNPSALQAPSEFCTYRIPANRAGSWADYPLVGINEKWFAVSVNNFRFGDGGFRRAHVYVVSVARITENATECPGLAIKRFDPHRGANGEPAFSVHPAQQYTPAANFPGTPLFMVSAAFNLPSREYTLWRITTEAGQPRLSKQLLTGDFAYGFAPFARQRGSSQELDSGDPRITQVAFRNGKVWAVHGTGCAIGPLPNEACIRAVEITPAATGPSRISYSETFGRPSQFFFWPGVAINELGDVAMAFQRAKPDGFLGVVFNGKRANAPHFDTMRNLRIGNCSLIHDPTEPVTRTGDYVGVQTDPADNLGFWITGEYPGTVRTSSSGCDWRTYVGRARY